jgi:UDP-N-acetylmuramate--alanine ligase
MTAVVDLSSPKSIHIIGIGGAGMAAIAEVLHGMGHTVSGSDMGASKAFDRLVAIGIDAVVGHDASNVDTPDVVARSTAIPDDNVEVQEVHRRGQDVLRRAEILGSIAALRRTVAVAGTHGKTTTSSMLAVIARQALVDPSFIIGGDVTELGTGANWGSGGWFVVEADESDGTFLELGHTIGIVTNVEPDHLEYYGNEANMRAAFAEFVSAAQVSVVCADDEGAGRLSHASNVVTYGAADHATYQMVNIERSPEATTFDLHRSSVLLGRLRVPMPGLHNARNATAATAAAMEMGLPFRAAQAALSSFGGVGRRFDPRGSAAGVTFIDDYAHLPTEVMAALDAAIDMRHERVVAVFQPHRFSRTEALWSEFENVFDAADVLVLTDIYPAGESPRPGVTGELIVEAVERGGSHPSVVYHADRQTLADHMLTILRPGDLCLTLGAGDLVALPDEVQSLLEPSAQQP